MQPTTVKHLEMILSIISEKQKTGQEIVIAKQFNTWNQAAYVVKSVYTAMMHFTHTIQRSPPIS